MLLNLDKFVLRVGSSLLRHHCYALESTFASVNNENFEDTHCLGQYDDFNQIRSDETKCLRIAIIGLPNVGKSTLINRLINRSICPVASKAHATRVKSDAVYVENKTQLVFMDTPGLVSRHEIKKFELEESFKKDARMAMEKADVVGVVQDASNKYTRLIVHKNVLELVKMTRVGVPTILIMNKVDEVKKKWNLLSYVRTLTSDAQWPNFSDVFMVSALTSDGVANLRNYFLDSAKVRDWEYPADVVTDQPPEKLIVRTVKAILLDYLPNEIPYQLKVGIELYQTAEDDSIQTIVLVECESERITKIVLGKQGSRIKMIARSAEQDLSNAFRTPVRLKIRVSVRPST